MAVDITLIVIGKAPTFVSAHAEGQYQKGDIFDVRLTSSLGTATPAFNRLFVWIHITDVPVAVLQKAKFLTQFNLDPASPIEPVLLSRRRWRGLLDDMPTPVKNSLRDAREVTVTWKKAKPFIKDFVADRLVDDGDFA